MNKVTGIIPCCVSRKDSKSRDRRRMTVTITKGKELLRIPFQILVINIRINGINPSKPS